MTEDERTRFVICTVAALLATQTASAPDREAALLRWQSTADGLLCGNIGGRVSRQTREYRQNVANVVATARAALRS